jgi:thiol:disulfide interchange protein
MISHRLRSLPVNGYYEYLSQNRCRVNVTPNEAAVSEETPKRTTTHHSVATVMENGTKTALVKSSSADNVPHQLSEINTKDVTKWSSTDVQHWIEDQCRKFELTKATTAKFQMNGRVDTMQTERLAQLCLFLLGQALVLLTKHDFLRRSPDGGEVLYYALQRLISRVFM